MAHVAPMEEISGDIQLTISSLNKHYMLGIVSLLQCILRGRILNASSAKGF